MSAEVLRRAAALMRERAQAATPGPWCVEASLHGDLFLVPDIERTIYGDNSLSCGSDRGTATHIASWHPLVALAVADWLDAEVETYEFSAGLRDTIRAEALAVARAYLGDRP